MQVTVVAPTGKNDPDAGEQLTSRAPSTSFATTGFPAMRACSGLLADVDQHAAAVRDALTEVSGRISAIGLAAYADGVCDSAGRHVWRVPDNGGDLDWSAPPWPLVRLLAVCVLADAGSVRF